MPSGTARCCRSRASPLSEAQACESPGCFGAAQAQARTSPCSGLSRRVRVELHCDRLSRRRTGTARHARRSVPRHSTLPPGRCSSRDGLGCRGLALVERYRLGCGSRSPSCRGLRAGLCRGEAGGLRGPFAEGRRRAGGRRPRPRGRPFTRRSRCGCALRRAAAATPSSAAARRGTAGRSGRPRGPAGRSPWPGNRRPGSQRRDGVPDVERLGLADLLPGQAGEPGDEALQPLGREMVRRGLPHVRRAPTPGGPWPFAPRWAPGFPPPLPTPARAAAACARVRRRSR